MVSVGAGRTGYCVSGIWPTDTNHYVVLARKVGDDVAFTLTAVLPADQDVHASDFRRCVQMQTCGNTHERVI